MVAPAGEAAVVQHQDAARLPDAGDPLGDQERGALEAPDGPAQGGVRREVQGAGAVVQDQDLRLLHESPGDGEPLALAAGEVAAILLQEEVQPAGLALHHLLRLGQGQGPPEPLVRGVLTAPEEVFPDAALEELGALGHHAHLLPEGILGEGADILAVQQDGAGSGVVKPGDEVHESALAAAGAADDADGVPWLRREGDAAEAGGASPLIGEAHIPELHGGSALGGGLRLGGIGHAGLHRQDGAGPLGAGQGFIQGDDEGGQLDELHDDLEHVVIEGNYLTLLENAKVHLAGGYPDQRHGAQVDEDVGEGVHESRDPAHKEVELREGPVAGLEVRDGLLLPAEGPDHPDAGEVFPGLRRDAVQPRLDLAEKRDADEHDAEDHGEEDGDGDGEDQGAAEVDGEGHHHGAQDDEGASQQEAEAEVEAVLHLVDVV